MCKPQLRQQQKAWKSRATREHSPLHEGCGQGGCPPQVPPVAVARLEEHWQAARRCRLQCLRRGAVLLRWQVLPRGVGVEEQCWGSYWVCTPHSIPCHGPDDSIAIQLCPTFAPNPAPCFALSTASCHAPLGEAARPPPPGPRPAGRLWCPGGQPAMPGPLLPGRPIVCLPVQRASGCRGGRRQGSRGWVDGRTVLSAAPHNALNSR